MLKDGYNLESVSENARIIDTPSSQLGGVYEADTFAATT